MELISVIIPVYNVEPYLERCIDSVLAQTYNYLQIILVDDGSSDKSGLICDGYKELDSRIRVIHKKNGGLADARNAGLQVAEGKYVGFVDSDDYIANDMYEKMYQALKPYSMSIACCGRVDLYEKGMKGRTRKRFVRKKEKFYNREEALKSLCLYESMDFSVCDKLFDIRLFQNICFPKGRTSEDVPVIYEVYKRAQGVIHIGEAKYYYCHRTGSTTGQAFYIRRLDYIMYIRDIYRDIIVDYPQVRKEAEVLLFRAIIYMWYKVHEANKDTSQYIILEKKLKKVILRFWIRYVANPYIEKEEYCRVINDIWGRG